MQVGVGGGNDGCFVHNSLVNEYYKGQILPPCRFRSERSPRCASTRPVAQCREGPQTAQGRAPLRYPPLTVAQYRGGAQTAQGQAPLRYPPLPVAQYRGGQRRPQTAPGRAPLRYPAPIPRWRYRRGRRGAYRRGGRSRRRRR